jgi:hypothetical protein
MPADPTSAFQPAEVWSFNGLALSQPFWNIATFGGARYNLPTLRGQNYAVPYRSGQQQRAKYADQRTITLTMWVDGTKSSTGLVVGDPRLAFNNSWQQLRQALWTRGGGGGSVQGTLQRQWYLTQSGVTGLVAASAFAEIAGSMDPTMNSRLNAVASIDFLLADPHFYGSLVTTAITSSGGTVTNPAEGTAGEGFPQPGVSQFTLQLTANTTVTNTTAGVSVTLNASGATFPVTLDILKDTATDAGGVNVIGSVTHSGARSWMLLLAGSNTITNTAGVATLSFNPPYI